ncbi:Semaphorin-2A [Camponotus floridanus]|uniref:Semaphorin-2A n=1 Tax=Camponotus floridanus TaxID=104421 RepID=E2A5Y2_CAMFO|nr:Semaphorin-2A [Camponotus floridanus]
MSSAHYVPCNSDEFTVEIKHVREFSCGMLYYRTLYLDSKRDALYVGAMDKIFRLNLSNISHSNCEVSCPGS